jgi:hypothetical protein
MSWNRTEAVSLDISIENEKVREEKITALVAQLKTLGVDIQVDLDNEDWRDDGVVYTVVGGTISLPYEIKTDPPLNDQILSEDLETLHEDNLYLVQRTTRGGKTLLVIWGAEEAPSLGTLKVPAGTARIIPNMGEVMDLLVVCWLDHHEHTILLPNGVQVVSR